jgi:hypothetical protein
MVPTFLDSGKANIDADLWGSGLAAGGILVQNFVRKWSLKLHGTEVTGRKLRPVPAEAR